MSRQEALDNAAYLINSMCIAQDGERVGMKLGIRTPDSSFLHMVMLAESTLGRDGSPLVNLENEKPGPVIVFLGLAKLETALQWVCFCTFHSLCLPMQHCRGFWPNSAFTYTAVKIKRINSIKVNKPQWDEMLMFQKLAKVMPVQPRAEFVPHAAASPVAHSSHRSSQMFRSQP